MEHSVGDEVTETKTEKLKTMHLCSGYSFTVQGSRLKDGSVAVSCTERGRGCGVRLRVRDGAVSYIVRGKHTHAPAPDRVASLKIREQVASGLDGAATARSLVDDAKDRPMTLAERAFLPQDASIKRGIWRRRQQAGFGVAPRLGLGRSSATPPPPGQRRLRHRRRRRRAQPDPGTRKLSEPGDLGRSAADLQ